MGKRKPTVVDQIMQVDAQLLVAGERLLRYRVNGPISSVIVQRGVVDRLLDTRLGLMGERDEAVTTT